MKKQFKSLFVIAALLAGMFMPVQGQTTTEGKRFWVALPFANGPSGMDLLEPFLAISAQKACDVTVSQPAGTWSISLSVGANSWTVLSNGNPDGQGREATVATPGTPAIPNNVWYDVNWTATSASEPSSPFPYALLVEATEDISLYSAMRGVASYDATNVLPEPTLQSEYIIQDYPPYNPSDEAHSLFVIVAATDNTMVEIALSNPTVKGTTGTIKTTLNKGQTYQVISKDKTTLSGTHIKAYSSIDHSDPKPIAVFSGADFTRLPASKKSARDCLYEQAMPVDYWGTEFVVTRSKDKDANRVRITASDNITDVYMENEPLPIKTLQPFETWEFEMSENLCTGEMAKPITEAGYEIPTVITGEAHYIKTSCPCAVYCYDVSRQYASSATTNQLGDPAMVWISPLQQRIGHITFGACGTIKCKSCSDKCWTNNHYVNIVCLTTDIPSVKLSSDKRASIPLDFQPVMSNPDYSYARVFLVDTDTSNPDRVYTLSSDNGVVAHVYGSGYNESYAYSVGSAAVKRGISVNGKVFTDGYVGDTRICSGTTVTFNAKVGNDEIERVDWNFGDGTSILGGPVVVTHDYYAATWYDVSATLYGHQVCTDEADQELGTVSFSFRVVRPDTIRHQPKKYCENEDYTGPVNDIDTVLYGCDSVVIIPRYHPKKSSFEFDTIANDICTIAGKTFTNSVDTTWIIPEGNSMGCDSVITCHLTIVKCLDLQVINRPDTQQLCLGETVYGLPVFYDRDGKAGDAYLILSDIKKVPVSFTGATRVGSRMVDTLTLPLDSWTPGYYTVKVEVEDLNCNTVFTSPELNFTVNYPQNIFAFKYNNVLAVYKKGHGGNDNYTFKGFQWYLNGAPIPGATSSIYHTEEPFTPGDSYYVMLTDNQNVSVPSCDFVIPDHIDDYNKSPNKAPAASKKLINRHIYIILEDRMYDAYGNRVK